MVAGKRIGLAFESFSEVFELTRGSHCDRPPPDR